MTHDKAVARVNALLKLTAASGATEGEERNARELAIAMIRKYGIEWEELKDPPFTRAALEAVEISEAMGEALVTICCTFEAIGEACGSWPPSLRR